MMKSFSLLRREIKEGLSELGFKRPTDIQELAIPALLKGKNALLIAPTGIGKTEAALLPIFDRFLTKRKKGISILYITPLRALNRDILERMEWWSSKLGIKIDVRHGDTSQYARRKQALDPPEMLITTPETLQAILPGSVMKEHLKHVRYVIVDEVHELAEDKRGAQLSVALERLQSLTEKEFQRIGISATIGSPEAVSRFLAGKSEIEILRVSPSKDIELRVVKPKPKKEDRDIAARIYSNLDASSRIREIMNLIRRHSSVLIFVNTREMAEILASRFKILGENVGIHHSSLSQEARIEAEQDFKEMRYKGLICTSSLELGIDVGSIELVIQYKSPRQVTRLLQRIGRSGHRIGKTSKGVVIATDADDIIESMVIARKALREELENLEVHNKPYDVLAHQLVGLALDRGEVGKKDALELLRRSSVYADLRMEELEEVLKLMSSLRLLWVREESFSKRKSSWKYYYENLSTIPDERRYFVNNLVSREGIGVLDEAFVVNYVAPGNLIIFKGAPWRVVSVDEEEITVEPVNEVTGAIPSWVGEEIPVPFTVARDVGVLRRKGARKGVDALADYSTDGYTKRLALSKVRRHLKEGIPIPSDKKILVEMFQDFAVIHSCFGMKVNQTLGRVFSTLLTAQLGHEVALQSDAYRIVLQFPYGLKKKNLKELFTIDSGVVEPLLSMSLKRSTLFRWKFVHIAKRFGAISKDVSYNHLSLRRIIDSYEGSIIYRETLKEIFKDNLDLENTARVLEGIKKGGIRVEYVELKKPSPLAELGLKAYGEIVLPKRAERMILKALEKRLGDKRVKLFCLYCVGWSTYMKVKNFDEQPECQKCSARMLAVLKGRYKEHISLFKRFKRGEKLSSEERQVVKRMQKSANLVLSYGKKAIIAQAGRGIGSETAKRVLIATRKDEELYRNILKAERDYARTKRFWD
jgi:ATP-dependent Lhr-like helicase